MEELLVWNGKDANNKRVGTGSLSSVFSSDKYGDEKATWERFYLYTND